MTDDIIRWAQEVQELRMVDCTFLDIGRQLAEVYLDREDVQCELQAIPGEAFTETFLDASS